MELWWNQLCTENLFQKKDLKMIAPRCLILTRLGNIGHLNCASDVISRIAIRTDQFSFFSSDQITNGSLWKDKTITR